ncbi:hypothetical protein [Lignipirellula cremea]|uniref:AAA+ ATPase domain-containing protein n=1 Tax=Lignipirellula cremea TaxID=2528010 RepID=A0A518DU40_9BACT|nr:hypothetical protein [Lignipirellula cremea]QDU95353.1 hypothetical protein Pla8534_31680 [Lignipirellula cremea]
MSSSNPFATRFTRPGAIPFLASADVLTGIVERLEHCGWQGQIVGPHGSGKSTLLESLTPLLQARGREVQRFTLHDGQRRFPCDQAEMANWKPTTCVVIDGYEQLGWWSRRRLRRSLRRQGAGLLATAHADVRLPEVYVMRPSLELTQQLAARLLGDPASRGAVTPDDVAASYQRHEGNVRETLFELYDLYELRQKNSL